MTLAEPKFIATDAGRSAQEKGDCTVRAFTVVADVPYLVAHRACAALGRKDRRSFQKFKNKVQAVASRLGIELVQVRRSGTLGRLIRDFPTATMLVRVNRHAFAVKQGVILDLSEQSLGRRVKGAWALPTTLPPAPPSLLAPLPLPSNTDTAAPV